MGLRPFAFANQPERYTSVFVLTLALWIILIDSDATKLAKYGVPSTWLATVKDKTLAYKANNTTKETLKTDQPKQTVEFKTVMADIKDYLLTLTNLVSGYKTDAPKFYEGCNALLAPKKKGGRSGSKKSTSKSLMRAKAAKKAQQDIDKNTGIVKDIL